MLDWFKRLLGDEDHSDDPLKDFDNIISTEHVAEYRKLGQASIPLDKIVGSVGRAQELNSNFRYRNRATTARYHRLDLALEEGKPMDPIKVLMLKRPESDTEYYVMDGHHRVAQAKKHGFSEINAEVTEVIIAEQHSDDATQ